MDIAGSHVALSRGQRSQPYPNILVSCQHETSFLSNQSDPAQPEPHRRSLCASPSSPGQGDQVLFAIPHTHQHMWGSQKRVLGAKAIALVGRQAFSVPAPPPGAPTPCSSSGGLDSDQDLLHLISFFWGKKAFCM